MRSWAVSHPRILRLNAALLNVLQTNSTDVNVTSDSGAQLARGTDYEVVPPTTARVVQHNATFCSREVESSATSLSRFRERFLIRERRLIQTGADSDLWGLYEKALANRSAWGYRVRALPGGALKPGQRVKLSYDVAAGAVGWGDWSSTPQVRHRPLTTSEAV